MFVLPPVLPLVGLHPVVEVRRLGYGTSGSLLTGLSKSHKPSGIGFPLNVLALSPETVWSTVCLPPQLANHIHPSCLQAQSCELAQKLVSYRNAVLLCIVWCEVQAQRVSGQGPVRETFSGQFAQVEGLKGTSFKSNSFPKCAVWVKNRAGITQKPPQVFFVCCALPRAWAQQSFQGRLVGRWAVSGSRSVPVPEDRRPAACCCVAPQLHFTVCLCS